MRSQEFTNPGSAGILLYAEDTGRYGFQQRSDSVNDPGVWAAWGGGRKSGESLEQCALRELAEESGYQGPVGLEPLARNSRYVTFIGRVPQEFDPTPNAEVKDHCWVDAGAWPSPMHPGMAAAVKQLGDTVNEANVLRLKDWEVTVSPHALQRTYERGVSAKAVDRILRTLDQIKSNIAGIEPGQPFIIHDQAGTALGMRRLAGNRLTLATVYSTDKDFQRGRYPTFAVSADVNQPLTESLSRVAFHYTSIRSALKIVSSGEFELSSTLGSVEQQYAPRGKPYFLSTTRSRQGGYHDIIGQQAVLFVLDGNWFNQHYVSRPVDYWENRNPSLPHHRTHEAEDRVFSSEPTIPTGGVTAIHVYVAEDADPEVRAQARQLLIAAKSQGIETHLYNDKTAWRNFDQRRTADVAQLTGQEPTRYRSYPEREYLLPWIELISAQNQGQLSKDADKLRYNLMYDYDRDNAAQGLGTDLSNARKPSAGADRANAVKIIKFMQRNGLATVKDLVQALSTKWRAEKKQAGVTESQTAKTGIMQTDVYGSRAYHARCLEPGCDWESKRYDRIQQAQTAAKKHAATHFDKKAVAENFADGITFSHSVSYDHEDNPIALNIIAQSDGQEVGYIEFATDDPQSGIWWSEHTAVNPQYQRQGIARSMYDYAKGLKNIVKQIFPSPNQSPGGKAIWKDKKVWENFADGQNPGRKGLAKRVGVNTKASISSLRKTAKNSSGEKQRMAHWLANMKSGRNK